MNKTIWKYSLDITDSQTLKMPAGAILLSAQFQGDVLCLWALVTPEAPKEERIITIIGTGNPVNVNAPNVFIGTVQQPRFPLVWHIFETLKIIPNEI